MRTTATKMLTAAFFNMDLMVTQLVPAAPALSIAAMSSVVRAYAKASAPYSLYIDSINETY
jgi:hypothetical protein